MDVEAEKRRIRLNVWLLKNIVAGLEVELSSLDLLVRPDDVFLYSAKEVMGNLCGYVKAEKDKLDQKFRELSARKD